MIEFLHQLTEIPAPYGSFYLISLFCILAIGIVSCIIFRKAKDKYLRIYFCVLWIIMVFFETLKLIASFTEIREGVVVWTFSPGSLSFQFCSLPLYFLPVVIFAKEGKIRSIFSIFLGTYGLGAAICVFVFPSTVLCELYFINFQTVVHHGIQLITGLVLLVRYFDKVNLKILAKTALLFFFTVMGARFLIELFHSYFPLDLVDYFYISPYTIKEFPIIGNLKQLIPNTIFVLGYSILFTMFASVIYLVPVLITRKWDCLKNSERRTQN